jgi:hypothetical protein
MEVVQFPGNFLVATKTCPQGVTKHIISNYSHGRPHLSGGHLMEEKALQHHKIRGHVRDNPDFKRRFEVKAKQPAS